MKIEGYQHAICLTLKKLSTSCSLLVITLDMEVEQQPLKCVNHKGRGGYTPLRVIIDNTTNNLIQEKHGKTLEDRKNNFSTLLVNMLSRLTLFSSK